MKNKERKRKNAKWSKEEAEMRRQDVKEAKREYMRKKKKKRKKTKWRRQEEENEAKRKRAEATKEQPSN